MRSIAEMMQCVVVKAAKAWRAKNARADQVLPVVVPPKLLCTICGQPSGRAAECWACFVAGDDAYRRAADR